MSLQNNSCFIILLFEKLNENRTIILCEAFAVSGLIHNRLAVCKEKTLATQNKTLNDFIFTLKT